MQVMGISTKRLGTSALVGVCVLGVGLAPCAAQGIGGGFRVGGMGPTPAAGVGPRVGPAVSAPATGAIVNNPYGIPGGPVGSMTSNPYAGSGDPGYGSTPYGAYILPDPYGGYLKGAADVINANGKYLIQSQQAYQIKEQTRTAMIENKRRVFDEWLYERANTPTLEDDREKMQREALRRALNDPPITEIWSGQSLNDLLLNAQKLQVRSAQTAAIPVEPDILAHLNVTSGRGNGALLKNEGNLIWPTSIRDLVPAAEGDRLRQEAQTYFKKAYEETKGGGNPGAGTMRELRGSIEQMRALLKKNSLDMTTSAYGDARRFLDGIDEAAKVLDSPDAGTVISNRLRPRGNNVGEVVQYMQQNGLRFAPAATGDEAAYNAMQRQLAAYNATIMLGGERPPAPPQ
jgi:hypothetical protein